MIKLSISVEMTDDRAGVYPVTPRVQVDFEREHKRSLVAAFSDEPSMEHLYWLGWRSMKAAGETSQTFDGWLDEVASVSPEGADDVPLGQPPS